MTLFETGLGQVEIRELATVEEMIAAEQIQLVVWGADIFPHPKEILIPIQHEGGLLAGAFGPENQMIGLVFHFPTRSPAVVHSQLLAVLDGWRGQGIGRRLKWFQRDWSLQRGIERVRWTVDPLRAANAELNMRQLGAAASVYYPDYYGPMQGIDAGAPTDRLLVEWPIRSRRVAALAELSPVDNGFTGARVILRAEAGKPIRQIVQLDGSPVLARLPEDFILLSKSEPGLALEWRMVTRTLFLETFKAGYAICGFTRHGGPAYLLAKETEWI